MASWSIDQTQPQESLWSCCLSLGQEMNLGIGTKRYHPGSETGSSGEMLRECLQRSPGAGFDFWSLVFVRYGAGRQNQAKGGRSQKGLESTEGSWHQRGFVLKRRLPAMTLQESCSDPEAIWLPSRHGKVPWRRAATFSIIKKDLFFHVLPWQPRLQP